MYELVRRCAARYFAALVAMAIWPLLPGALATAAVFVYLTGYPGKIFCLDTSNNSVALMLSLLVGGAVWFLAAFIYSFLVSAESAVPSSFGELDVRLTQLKAIVEGIDADAGAKYRNAEARKEIDKLNSKIDDELKKPGLRWVLGSGYVNVWDLMYRSEEALIEIEPKEMVIAGALYDESRLQGSAIQNCDDLLAKIRQAVIAIDSKASVYLKPCDPGKKQLAIITGCSLPEGVVDEEYNLHLYAFGGTLPYTWKITGDNPAGLCLDNTGLLRGKPATEKYSFTVQVTDNSGLSMEKQFTLTARAAAQPPGNTKACMTDSESTARAVLRKVRRSINEYRGINWDGMIVLRNRLLGAGLATSITAYGLLAIAIYWRAPKDAIIAVSAFYLVGTTIGLFSRLRTLSESDSAVEDYGLSAARLIIIPVFSGLAAISGVALVAMAPHLNTIFEQPKPEPPKIAVNSIVTPPSERLAIITTSPLTEGKVDVEYDQQLQASGGKQPYIWNIIGERPDGLALDQKTGMLTGKPTTAKINKFKVRVTDAAGKKEENEFSLTIKQDHPDGAATSTPLLLRDIFNLDKWPIALLIAAIFGLTPKLLIDDLLKQTETIKKNLKTSEATQQETKKE